MAENYRSAEVDAFIGQYPEEVQVILQKLRDLVHEEAPGVEETIAYAIPTFRLGGNLVHFNAYKKHIGFYPTPPAIEHFADELKGYKHAKGSVQFPMDQPIPYDLIRRMVAFRVQQNLAKLRK